MSKMFNVNWKDLLKAFIVCVFSVLFYLAIYYVAKIKIVDDANTNAQVISVISLFLGYLFKQFCTDGDTGKTLGMNLNQ